MFRPAYLSLGSAELHRRARRAIATLAECRACPRDCGVNRLEDKWAACKTGRYAIPELFKLRDRLAGKVEMDFGTARRLFTLICALHMKT